MTHQSSNSNPTCVQLLIHSRHHWWWGWYNLPDLLVLVRSRPSKILWKVILLKCIFSPKSDKGCHWGPRLGQVLQITRCYLDRSYRLPDATWTGLADYLMLLGQVLQITRCYLDRSYRLPDATWTGLTDYLMLLGQVLQITWCYLDWSCRFFDPWNSKVQLEREK